MPEVNDAGTLMAYFTGAIGMLLEWRAYTLHCGKRFRIWSALGALLWAAMYAGLGAWTSSMTMGATALRSVCCPEGGRYRHRVAFSFTLLFAGLTAMSWQGAVSLLPAFAVINTTLALAYLNNRSMRMALLGSSLAWISNDILWAASPALLAELVAALLNVRTIYRMVET